MNTLRYYISTVDIWATEVKDTASNSPISKANCLSSGSLFTHYATQASPTTGKSVVKQYNNLDNSIKYYLIDLSSLEEIKERAYKFLLPLFSDNTRIDLYLKDNFTELCSVSVEDHVVVLPVGRTQKCLGVVKYTGALRNNGKGMYIGVELEEPVGNCNGVYKDITYFTCQQNYGVFITIDKIISITYKSCLNGHDENIHPDLISFSSLPNNENGNSENNVDSKRQDFAQSGRDNAIASVERNSMDLLTPKSPPNGHLFANHDNSDVSRSKENGFAADNSEINPPNYAKERPGVILPPGITLDMASALKERSRSSPIESEDVTPPETKSPGTIRKATTSLENIANHVSASGKNAKSKVDALSSDIYQCAVGRRKQSMPSFKNLIMPNELRSHSWDERTKCDAVSALKAAGLRKVQSQDCSSTSDASCNHVDPLLQVDSVVEHQNKAIPQFGVIRWMGYLPGTEMLIAGLELEEAFSGGCDGKFKGKRYFQCSSGRGLFIPLSACKRDSRFNSLASPDPQLSSAHPSWELEYKLYETDVSKQFVGSNRGIQGHLNSCYMDATLFAMFAYNTVFDSILLRKKRNNDVENYENVQDVLRCGIVNPLRKNGFVSASNILEFRTLLDKLGSVTGLLNQEKDPEEFLTLLLKDILKAEPFVKLRTHQNQAEGVYFCQILMGQNRNDLLPSVQSLLEQSFFATNLQISEIPSVFVVQMPRFGSEKIYKRIKPSYTLDLANVIQYASYSCFVCCSRPGSTFCNDCYTEFGWHMRSFFFCPSCFALFHSHGSRAEHKNQAVTRITQPTTFTSIKEDLKMELFAVVCIKTSHYVSFVNTSMGEPHWVFFDSMADRKGGSDGYNIPEVIPCPEINTWLKHDTRHIVEADSRVMPEKVQRLFEDAYLCFYRNKNMEMYK